MEPAVSGFVCTSLPWSHCRSMASFLNAHSSLLSANQPKDSRHATQSPDAPSRTSVVDLNFGVLSSTNNNGNAS